MRSSPNQVGHFATALPRTPLVPDKLLKTHNVYFDIDTRFRRAARILQALWLADNNIPTGIHVSQRSDHVVTMELGSILDHAAAAAGKNFISPDVHALVRREIILSEEGAALDQERLFCNALSSMPLCFNVFGSLKLRIDLAGAVFKRLLPDFVSSVTAIGFEHSPGRREARFLNDGTAFDVVLDIVSPDGEVGKVYIEVKYSEDMSGPAARWRDRYDEAAKAVRLYKDPDSPVLRSLACEQFFREHTLAQLAVDCGITHRAVFVAIGPRLNRRVQAAFRTYVNELIDTDDQDDNRVAFEAITLERLIEVIGEAGAPDLSRALWQRYADFERVLNASLISEGLLEEPIVVVPSQTDSSQLTKANSVNEAPPPRRTSTKRKATNVKRGS